MYDSPTSRRPAVTDTRAARLDAVVAGALGRPPEDRESFVAQACGDDDALRDEALSLLAHASAADGFLDSASLAKNALNPGQQLGHYRIVAFIGAGGMGEVYRATDTRLGRDVALKILPADLATDSEHLRRFKTEARAVAALNHPNIVTLHSVEEDDGVQYLTMELVDGTTLIQHIGMEGMPLDELLRIAIPLADALASAHARGIVHRDLKPGNVMFTGDGRVKVLDFGLAKLKPVSPDNLSQRSVTEHGRLLGTVAYMSPEQAEGRPIDHRSDIFSFGVLLYELATGRRPFTGDTNVAVLSSILRATPRPVSDLKPNLPSGFVRIVERCLAKDPDARYQSAKDLCHDLDTLAAYGEARVTYRGHRTWKIAAFASVGALALVVWQTMGLPSDETLTPEAHRLTTTPGEERSPALSPDGKWLLYMRNGDIYSQAVDGQVAGNLTPDSPQFDSDPAFSPDGTRIAFRSTRNGGGIFVMGADGSGPRQLTNIGFHPEWTPDGNHIVYATVGATGAVDIAPPSSEVWKVEVATEKATRISVGDCLFPTVSPTMGVQRLACTSRRLPGERDAGRRSIITMRLDGSDVRRVTDDAAMNHSPMWSHDGRHLYFVSDRGGTMGLWRVGIDVETGRLTGEPQQVFTPSQWVGTTSRSDDGRLIALTSYDGGSQVERVPFDPVQGKVTGPAQRVTNDRLAWRFPEPSPDGQRVAMSSFLRWQDIYVIGVDGSRLTRLTDDVHEDRRPRWSPRGDRIAFFSTRGGIHSLWTVRPDGGGLREIVRLDGVALISPVWSPDGLRIAASEITGQGRTFIFPVGDDPAVEPLDVLPPLPGTVEFEPKSWSGDGQRIVGTRVRAGSSETIWVYDVAKRQYSEITTGGIPSWLKDGKRLVFRRGDRIMLIDTLTRNESELWSAPHDPQSASVAIDADNRWIYYTTGSVEADIWLLKFK